MEYLDGNWNKKSLKWSPRQESRIFVDHFYFIFFFFFVLIIIVVSIHIVAGQVNEINENY